VAKGEVESIAQMKAKAQNEHEDGLLEYLEDIIGTTRYKQPIEEASQEVESLNEARGEKMNRLRVVEREKAALEVSRISASAIKLMPFYLGEEAGSGRFLTGFERSYEEEVVVVAIPHVYPWEQLGDHHKSYCTCPFSHIVHNLTTRV
jgi:hypothetical protein